MKFLGFVRSIVAPIRTRRTRTTTTNVLLTQRWVRVARFLLWINLLNLFHVMAWNYGGKPQTSQNRHKEQRASFCPPFVFSSGEKAALQLCLNHVKPLRSPQPKLLDESIVFSLVKLFFFSFASFCLLINRWSHPNLVLSQAHSY